MSQELASERRWPRSCEDLGRFDLPTSDDAALPLRVPPEAIPDLNRNLVGPIVLLGELPTRDGPQSTDTPGPRAAAAENAPTPNPAAVVAPRP